MVDGNGVAETAWRVVQTDESRGICGYWLFGTEAAAVDYFKDNDGKLASLFPPGGWAAPTASIVDTQGTGLGLKLAAERSGYMTIDAKDSDLFATVRNLPVLGSTPIRKPVRAPLPPRFAVAL